MAGESLRDTTGVDFLNSCQAPPGREEASLLITYGDIATGRAGVRAMALGLLDDYLKAVGRPRARALPVFPELLSQRARAAVAAGSQPVAVRVVGWLNAASGNFGARLGNRPGTDRARRRTFRADRRRPALRLARRRHRTRLAGLPAHRLRSCPLVT